MPAHPKVVLYLPELGAGGPDRVFFELACAFRSSGVKPVVLVERAGGRYWDALPATIQKVCLADFATSPLGKYPVKAYAKCLKAIRPDAVLCSLRSSFTAAAAKAAGLAGPRLIVRPANHLTQNALELWKSQPLKHSASWLANVACMQLADHVVCQSVDLFEDLRRYRVAASKMSVIGNPISVQGSAALANGASNATLPGAPAILAAGRLMPQKGFDRLITAFAQIAKKVPSAHITIVGEGPERAKLEQLCTQFGLANRVSLPGHSKRLPELMQAADYVVSSSRYEGFPNVLLEALNLGTPVIAVNCPGGTRDLVRPGKTGWLLNAASDEQLASGLLDALNDRNVPKRAELQAFVAQHYSVAHIAGEYAQVVQKVCSR